MDAYIRFILRNRWSVLCGLVLMTVASAWMMSQGIVASSLGRMFLGEHPAYARYLERVKDFGSDEIIVVGYETRNPLLPAEQARLRPVLREIERLPLVADTRSVLDAQWTEGDGEALRVHSYAGVARRDPGESAALIDRMETDPFAAGLLISSDGQAAAVVIELAAGSDRPVERLPEMMEGFVAAFEAGGFEREALHVVGLPATVGAVIDTTYWNFKTLFPVVCVVLLLAVWVMFRRLWPVFIAFTVAGVAVVWTMGFAVLLDRHVSVLVSTVPAVILVISFSDVIHLVSAYLLELGARRSKGDAILAAGTDVGIACLWTSATTFVGFVALALVPTPIFRQLGLVLGVGVGGSLLIAVTLVPILFSLLPAPVATFGGAVGGASGAAPRPDRLGRVLERVAAVSRRQPRQVVAFFGLMTIAAVIAATHVHVETDFAERLDGDHRVRQDMRWFQERFAGASTLDIYVSAETSEGLLQPELMRRLDLLQRRIAEMPGVTRVVSLVDLFKEVHGALHAGEATGAASGASRLPGSVAALAQELLLFEGAGGDGIERLIDFERRRLRVVVTLSHEQVRETFEAGQRALAAARDLFGPEAPLLTERLVVEDAPEPPGVVHSRSREAIVSGAAVEIEASGLLYLMGDWLQEIVTAQKRSLLYAFFFITLMMIMALRSLRVGLWSMLPNLFPILALAGWLGLTWDAVDSDVMGLAVIALGIGVDDTIHFLVRLKREWARAESMEQALARTFHFTGRGIVITTLILAVGFAPFYAANYLSVRVMGNLLPMTLVLALVADLFLVPALVQLGWIRFPKGQVARPD